MHGYSIQMPVIQQWLVGSGVEHGVVVEPLFSICLIPEKIVQQQMNTIAGFQVIIIFVLVFLELIPVHPGKIKFRTSGIIRTVKHLHFKVDPFPTVHFLETEIQESLVQKANKF